MFILQSRLKIGFMSKTVVKIADGGTLVRPKEIRPSTGNDVIVQISKNRNKNLAKEINRPFPGLTYVFDLKPISILVFK